MKQTEARKKYENVNEYIALFPKEVATRLTVLRRLVKKNAPEAKESISYEIPAYKLNETQKGRVVYFAAYAKHIGLYPAVTESAALQKKLQPYLKGKTLQFIHVKPLPLPLIEEFVRSRAKMCAAAIQTVKGKVAKKKSSRK